jgi:hypothetical protein
MASDASRASEVTTQVNAARQPVATKRHWRSNENLCKDERGSSLNRRQLLKRLFTLSSAGCGVMLTGCGSVLHSERIHSHHSRDIDWKIAALNGLGLAFFFVPGVIAFAVDFYTGAIYLPPEHYGAFNRNSDRLMAARASRTDAIARATPASRQRKTDALQRISVPPKKLNLDTIDRVVSDRLGTQFKTLTPRTRVSDLEALAAFDAQVEKHRNDPELGRPASVFFRLVG